MKIGLISDIHIGDYRRNKEFDIHKLKLLKKELNSSRPDIILNTADTVSRDKYLRPEETKEAYWEQYLEFKSTLSCPVIEVCINRESAFFTKIFNLSDNYYRTDFKDCTFFSIAPEYDNDHTLSKKQLEWLESEFKNLNSRWQFVLTHVPIEQATERAPGKGIYLSDSKILKDIACKHGIYTFFIGGHLHKMPLPKAEPRLAIIMAGLVDSLVHGCNELSIRYLEINEVSVELKTVSIDMLSAKYIDQTDCVFRSVEINNASVS